MHFPTRESRGQERIADGRAPQGRDGQGDGNGNEETRSVGEGHDFDAHGLGPEYETPGTRNQAPQIE